MDDSVSAVPAIIVLLIGVASLGLGVAWLMTASPPFGALGTLGALGGYIAACLVTLKAFTN